MIKIKPDIVKKNTRNITAKTRRNIQKYWANSEFSPNAREKHNDVSGFKQMFIKQKPTLNKEIY